jgi:hypothetical protein
MVEYSWPLLLQVAPNDADTVLNAAALMWETQFTRKREEERDPARARELIDRALVLDPLHVGALCLKGMWHLRAMGDLAQGVDCLKQAVAIDPSSAVARNGLQWIQAEGQKRDRCEGSAPQVDGQQRPQGSPGQGSAGAGARVVSGALEHQQVEVRASGAGGPMGPGDTGGDGNGRPAGSQVDESESEPEGPRRGAYYETVGGLHPLPADVAPGTIIGGEGTFGRY